MSAVAKPASAEETQSAPAKLAPDLSVGAKGSRTPSQIALSRLARDPIAMMSFGCLAMFIVVALGANLISDLLNLTPDTTLAAVEEASRKGSYSATVPTLEHPFGQHPKNGSDLFAMWLHGSRPSLLIAITVVSIAGVIGTIAGLTAGFLGGWVDSAIGWVIDFILSLPFLLIAIAVVPIALNRALGSGTRSAQDGNEVVWRFLILAGVLAFFGWAGLARLVRGEVMSLREQEFVQAARSLGLPTRHILFKEVLPNILGRLTVWASAAVPAYVSIEAGLSMLGVGLKPPTVSWGQTIFDARTAATSSPLYLILPVLGIALLVLCLSLLGDAISDAYNPQTRR